VIDENLHGRHGASTLQPKLYSAITPTNRPPPTAVTQLLTLASVRSSTIRYCAIVNYQSFINNKRADWPLTMLYKNIKIMLDNVRSFFSSAEAHRVPLISISVAFSQTPVYVHKIFQVSITRSFFDIFREFLAGN